MVSRMMKNLDIFIVSFAVISLAVFGKLATRQGLPWYELLKVPDITPEPWVFGIVWTALYIMMGCAAITLIRAFKHIGYYRLVLGLFMLNLILNPAWSYLFFVHHSIIGALIDCFVLECNLLALIAFTWADARYIALLVVPSAVWVAFALYLNYQIFLSN